MISDGTDDDRTNRPEHLQHLGSRCSQFDGRDLGAVGRCVCNEDTPWDAFEQLGRQHDLLGVGKVKDKDKGIQKHEAPDGRPSVSDFAGNGTGEEDANECTDWSSHLKGGLPRSRNNKPAGIGVDDAVFVSESRQGDEVAHEEDAVGFHDLEMTLAVMPRQQK